MAGFLTMTNLGRIAKLIALLLFVLPWVTVSCADQTLVSMTGVDLATGHVNLTANPMGGPAMSAPSHGGDMLVIIGAALIVLGLVVGFVLKGAKGAMAAAACAAISAVLLAYTVFVRVKAQAVSDGNASAGGESSSFNPQQLADMIHVNVQVGFYLCLAALIAAVAFDLLSTKVAAAPGAAAAPRAQPPPSA